MLCYGVVMEPEPHFDVVLVTPEMAAQWLDKCNTHNRPVKWMRVKQYAGAIRRGEWKLNGDAIRFDINNVLLDGQNRLWAVVEAEIPITTLVATDLPSDTQDTMDSGIRRSFSDVLALRGEKNVSTLSSLTNWLWRWEQHDLDLMAITEHRVGATIQQSSVFFDDNRAAIVEAAKNGQRLAVRPLQAPKLPAAACWFRFHAIAWEDCEDFFYRLGLGASLEEDNPIFALRRYVGNLDRRPGYRSPGENHIAVFVKAWNAYRQGQRVKSLAWRAGGANPEIFPTPK